MNEPDSSQRAKGEVERKADTRAASRDLKIPDVKNPKRRKKCEADDCLWLQTYIPDVFYNPFTRDQKKIIADCAEALKYGTKKCKAAPRGDGKSSIIKYLALKYGLARQVRFPLILAGTGSKAKKILNSQKRRLASPVDSPLREDYPLECTVAKYVHPAPARSRNVTANGRKAIDVHWGPDWISLPTWESAGQVGPIFLALGYSSDELQGCNIFDIRPDFVMLDDLDSRDSLAAEDGIMAQKIEEAIDKTVAGLGGQSRRLGQFMLCTVTSIDSAAYKYSDPAIKPAFSGERIAAIQKWPERMDLWETYIELRQAGQRNRTEDGRAEDPHGREAYRFYLKHRKKMDAGAVLSNPHNFNKEPVPDGTPKEISALQKCFDYIADNGRESFETEHQQNPPIDAGEIESNITPYRVQRQLSGYPRGIIPPGCSEITCGVDCKKNALHWVVRAWLPNGTGYTLDYGIYEVIGGIYGSDEGMDLVLHNAILGLMEQLRETIFATAGGEVQEIGLILIDAGWMTDSVYSACARAGLGVKPIMGVGKSAGCVQANFSDVQRTTKDRKPGDGWFLSRKKRRIWLVNADADRWKRWEHDRWMTAPGKPGCMYLFGVSSNEKALSPDEKMHHSYAHHICNEIECEEVKGGKLRRTWKAKSVNIHYRDASYYADVAAAMKGIALLPELKAATDWSDDIESLPSLSDLQKGNHDG